eukprot:scaffold51825_cov61-Phaeocystis_antarctica.AAC.4
MADGLLARPFADCGWRIHLCSLGPKPLLAKLREQQSDLGAGNKEVREALAALKAEREATESKAREAAAAPLAAATPPAVAAPSAPGESGAPLPASLAPSLACFGCARLPSEMDVDWQKQVARFVTPFPPQT